MKKILVLCVAVMFPLPAMGYAGSATSRWDLTIGMPGSPQDDMVEHDIMVGQVLKQLDDLGIADNTIFVYGTDNGAETGTWPDGGTTPFHGEKGTTWEGGSGLRSRPDHDRTAPVGPDPTVAVT